MNKTLDQLRAEEPSNVKKSFELKGTLDDSGEFEGIANVTGIMDRGGDVIAPGAFKSALPKFLKEGFVAVGHDWESLPVAYPTKAQDTNEGLKVTAKFHTTLEGQNARTVVKERLDAGLTVGLSVGMRPDRDKCAWFESGKALWEFCEENKIHDGLDKKSIMAWKGYCRLMQGVKELFEYSIVTIPMNQPSTATSAKSERKSKSTSVGAILQAKIHQSFTVAADELAIRGYMDTDERIELSGVIGNSLKLFRSEMNEEVAEREIEPLDVDWVASKDLSTTDELPAGKSLVDHLDSVLAAVEGAKERLDGYKARRDADDRPVSPERLDQAKAIHSAFGELIELATPKSEEPVNDLKLRLLRLRASQLKTPA